MPKTTAKPPESPETAIEIIGTDPPGAKRPLAICDSGTLPRPAEKNDTASHAAMSLTEMTESIQETLTKKDPLPKKQAKDEGKKKKKGTTKGSPEKGERATCPLQEAGDGRGQSGGR